jgi:hypothetical protein
MRDTQKMMYALDLKPGAFKISRNEGVNLAYLPVNTVLKDFENSSLVASSYSFQDERLTPGLSADGRDSNIVSFDAILKYGKFPLSDILSEILGICKKELASEIEIEFAADTIPDAENEILAIKLLQVRPIRDYMDIESFSMEKVSGELGSILIRSETALGAGYVGGMDYIVIIPPERFVNSKTREMAEELGKINSDMKTAGKGYLLAGPGRWGSSDPFLGIPVAWNDISEAKTIVECGIRGFQVEPSQGTHFFQNITSLGVGYMSVNSEAEDGSIDLNAIASLKCVLDGKYAKVYETPKPLKAFIERSTNKAIAGY